MTLSSDNVVALTRRATRTSLSVPMSEIDPEEVEWLWFPYIPRAKLTMLDGDPGVGKSFLTLAIAAAVSQGRALGPGARVGKPGNVLLLAAEDGAADTIRPRLDACDADVGRIHIVTDPLNLDEDGAKALKREIVSTKAVLVEIDPIQSYFPHGANMNAMTDVRPVMKRLAEIAADTGAAIVLIRHLNKGQGGSALYKGIGSIDFTAAVRSELLVGLDPSNHQKSVLAHQKCNIEALGPSLVFSKEGGVFAWLGTSSLRADDLVAPPDDADVRSSIAEAAEFLTELLAAGPVLSETIAGEASKRRITPASLRRAKERLGVRSRKLSAEQAKAVEGAEAGQWACELPLQGAHPGTHEHLEHVEHLGSPN
jgi:hypothetical protein